MLDKQPYFPFFGLYYMVTTLSNHLSINYTISIHEWFELVKAKKTQTEIWVKFLLYINELSLLYPTPSPTVETSWSVTHCVGSKKEGFYDS